jgi:hypothetical protein
MALRGAFRAGLRATLAKVSLGRRHVAAQPTRELSLIAALGAGLALAVMLNTPVLGAEPSPILIDPLDPRAEGEGPGLVGDPLLAALIVLVLGLLAAAAAALYVRLTRPG